MEITPDEEAIIQMIEEYNNKLYDKFIKLFSVSLKDSDNVCMLFDSTLYELFKTAIKENPYKSFGNDYEFFHLFKDVMSKFYSIINERASKLEDDSVF